MLHYNPVSRCGTNLEKTSFFVVMEKAARFDESAGLEGEWKIANLRQLAVLLAAFFVFRFVETTFCVAFLFCFGGFCSL